MLQLNYLRENTDEVINRLKTKNFDAGDTIAKILQLDTDRRRTQKEADDNLAKQNNLAKQTGQLYKDGKAAEAESLKAETAELKEQNKGLQEKIQDLEKEQEESKSWNEFSKQQRLKRLKGSHSGKL